jgi:GH18 family chitinase
MHRITFLLPVLALLCQAVILATEPAQILTNHLGYDAFGPKHAVIRGAETDQIDSFEVRTYPGGSMVLQGKTTATGTVDKWRDWRFWSLDFSDLEAEGSYVIECSDKGQTLRSFPFRIQKNILERFTLSDVIFYFKSMRSSGANDRADRKIGFQNSKRAPIDAHGGWYDASGDYGIHMSHLDFSSYFNPQQLPLTAFSLGKTRELLEARRDPNFKQILRRLIDETTFGADYLVRVKAPNGSFYQTINAYTPDKKPEDRRFARTMAKGFTVRLKATDDLAADKEAKDSGVFEVGYRNGGGFSIAALAIAARSPVGGDFDTSTYLKTAEQAFAFLESHNKELLNDGKENIVDDYCALVAASELFRTSKQRVYAAAGERRANSLMDRLISRGSYKDYWRSDDQDRPFFHAVDAGAPVVSLLDFYDVAGEATRNRIRDAVKRSLAFELRTTNEVPNPFGLARQYVQHKAGARNTSFFYPHDSGTAPWWQGENARLASLSAAARLAAPLFPDDPAFQAQLQAYAADQLNWILGMNPFDASMLQGTGRNNPEYVFFSSWEYKSAPGGICNGITSGYKDEHDIDLNVPYEVTGQDSDWRWAEQWIPHTSWYLLAVAAGKTSAPPAEKAIIGYVFCEDERLKPQEVAAEKLTHINYAFANIQDGRMVEGFKEDAGNFKLLNSLKARNPKLKILVSVGGWTWSGNFSDMALTSESRRRFIDSAVDFVERHKLDGLDVDWEFPGQKGLNNVNRPEDRENSTALLAELRAALDKAGKASDKHYLLTMATAAGDEWLEHTEMHKASAYLDFVNLMAYDMFEEESDPIAAHHAPLFTHPANPKKLSAASAISHYIAAGVPAEKIVLGVPFYGHAWGEVPATGHGLYQPGKALKRRIPASFQAIHDNLVNKDGFVRYWDDISKAPFLYNAQSMTFVSYEDEESAAIKARYVVDRGLGGIMFWQYAEDPDGKLLDAIRHGFPSGHSVTR